MFKFQTIGTDPEFFTSTVDGTIVPFFTLETKKKKTSAGVEYYPDNALLEFNVPPVKGVGEIPTLSQRVKEAIEEIQEKYKVKIVDGPTASIEYSGSSPLWLEIGCQPFFVVGKGQVKPVPYEGNTRFAGGHIHLGYDTSLLSRETVVRVLDKVLYSDDPFREASRDAFYGQRLSYRPKPYGVEYRSPSNFWIFRPEWLEEKLKKAEQVIDLLIKKGVK